MYLIYSVDNLKGYSKNY